MKDILLAIVVSLYAFWGWIFIQKADACFEIEDEEAPIALKGTNPQEKMTVIAKLLHRLLGWYRHPRLSRLLYRILMHL